MIHGFGEEAGGPLVESRDVDVISFTGSTAVGRYIAQAAGARLAKVCLELGGKNPLIVCDDANLDVAVEAAVLSAFSNAGQRCAAGSRIIVFDAIYERFRERLLARVAKLRVGASDDDDFGPVINEGSSTECSGRWTPPGERRHGAEWRQTAHRTRLRRRLSTWRRRCSNRRRPDAEISRTELFGPISVLYRVAGFEEALALANESPYGLTASIHTDSVHRGMTFLNRVRAGVAVINGATYGSEPHLPFGGLRDSGTGGERPGPRSWTCTPTGRPFT